jgi:hypothetical protein
VIQDGNFASEGFSQTWQPHLWRIKATPMVNAQEYSQIINQPFMPENIWDSGNFYPAGEVVNNGNTYYRANKMFRLALLLMHNGTLPYWTKWSLPTLWATNKAPDPKIWPSMMPYSHRPMKKCH